jgi:soluble lytic murein transglycosylase-like protein
MIDPIESSSGMARLMEIANTMRSKFNVPLGAAGVATTGQPKFASMYKLAQQPVANGHSQVAYNRTNGFDRATDAWATSGVAVKSKLDWSSPDEQVPAGTPYAAEFTAAGRRWGISPKLLAAQAEVESRFRIDAVSKAGAVGIMQFMPSTAKGMGVDPLNPASAINGAAQYLKNLTDRFGSIDVALAAYNVGSGTVTRAGGTVPPSAHNYVSQILARANGGSQ